MATLWPTKLSFGGVMGLPSAWAILAGNMVPMLGVLFWGWSIAALLILYWFETAIVGFFCAVKILVIRPQWAAIYVLLIGFICGFTMFVHGAFLAYLLQMAHGGAEDALARVIPPIVYELIVGAIALIASHACAFVFEFILDKESARPSADDILEEPYPRLAAMHCTLFFGFIALFLLRGGVGLLALLVILKTVVDLVSYGRVHERRTSAGSLDPNANFVAYPKRERRSQPAGQ